MVDSRTQEDGGFVDGADGVVEGGAREAEGVNSGGAVEIIKDHHPEFEWESL